MAEQDDALRARLSRALEARGCAVTEVATLRDLMALLALPDGGCVSVVVTTRDPGDLRPGLQALDPGEALTELEAVGAAMARGGDAESDELHDRRLAILTASRGPAPPRPAATVMARIARLRSLAAEQRGGAAAAPDLLVGVSPAMVSLMDVVRQVAPSDVSVLITGGTGTGKERIARALHAQSARAHGPFMAISCAAMPEALLESELFGHVRGAFTGAVTHRGLLVAASGGTLFLDEVGDAPLGIQRKLLRVLQERRVRPVGSATEEPFDVRVISATHRDLKAAIRREEFREDLFYRLAVVSLEVPPLHDRGDDILLLAQDMLDEHHAAGRTAVRGLTEGAAARLLDYTWPGNVRELRNCIDRAVALARHEWLTVADLPPAIVVAAAAAGDVTILCSLDELQRAHMARVLAAVGGNKTVAARILGCDRRTLYRKLGAGGAAEDARSPH